MISCPSHALAHPTICTDKYVLPPALQLSNLTRIIVVAGNSRLLKNSIKGKEELSESIMEIRRGDTMMTFNCSLLIGCALRAGSEEE